MTDDQIIDKLLKNLFESQSGTEYLADICESIGLDNRAFIEFVARLEEEKLATPNEPRHRMTITTFGRQVCKEGGWIAYVERQKTKTQADSLNKQLTAEKLIHDTMLSRWQLKTRWWPLIISVISLIVSIIAVILSRK
jgi:hypothetical protein